MIQLKTLLTEQVTNITVPFKGVKPGGLDGDISVNFTVHIAPISGIISFMPKTSKDLDLIKSMGLHDESISILLRNHLKRKSKLVIKIAPDYKGAGYGFRMDFDEVIKKIK